MHQFLICEDDQDMVDFLNLYLNTKGYQYLIVDQGGKVLPTLKAHKIDFLLLDLGLPDMDGAEVVDLVRNDPSTRDLPIYIFSASINSQKIRELNVNGVLNKPFELQELDAVIEKHIH
ncbi:MAG: response regulator [Candidatus Cyclobacteriaceae bacterium M3_2C_046]